MAEAKDQEFYNKVFPVPDRVREKSYIKSRAEYEKLYKESITDPNAFWAKMANERLTWFKPFDPKKVSDWSFDAKDVHSKWFEGGKINVSYRPQSFSKATIPMTGKFTPITTCIAK